MRRGWLKVHIADLMSSTACYFEGSTTGVLEITKAQFSFEY